MSDHDRVVLETSATRTGESRWNWSVWIEGGEAVLDLLASVRYVLHPTFPDPIRVVTDRATKFRLDAVGWGEFAIAAEVTRKDGRTFELEKWLDLGLGGAATDPSQRKPCVFLSFGAADAPWARALRENLATKGVEVLSPHDMPAGASFGTTIADTIQRCDLVAVMTNGELRGFAEVELKQARERHKPYVPILVGREASVPSELADVKPVQMYTRADAGAVADAIRARVLERA